MVHRLSKMIANFLLHKNVISETVIDIYIYGYETVVLGIIDFFIVLAVGLIFNKLITMMIFLHVYFSKVIVALFFENGFFIGFHL